MTQRMAIYMQDRIDIREELDLALYMEDRGFSEIWQGDNRLARDCIVAMSAFLTHTRRIKVAAGVLPIWTRNPVVIAASFSTMWELGGKVDGQGRVMLGLGAWWEPIAGRVGVDLCARSPPCERTSRPSGPCSPWSRSPTTATSCTSTA